MDGRHRYRHFCVTSNGWDRRGRELEVPPVQARAVPNLQSISHAKLLARLLLGGVQPQRLGRHDRGRAERAEAPPKAKMWGEYFPLAAPQAPSEGKGMGKSAPRALPEAKQKNEHTHSTPLQHIPHTCISIHKFGYARRTGLRNWVAALMTCDEACGAKKMTTAQPMQYVPPQFQVALRGFKWPCPFSSGPPRFQVALRGFKWPCTVSSGPPWFQVPPAVSSGPPRFQVALLGFKWPSAVSSGPPRFQVALRVSKWPPRFQVALRGFKWPFSVSRGPPRVQVALPSSKWPSAASSGPPRFQVCDRRAIFGDMVCQARVHLPPSF
eukprot:gene6943-biopygen7462